MKNLVILLLALVFAAAPECAAQITGISVNNATETIYYKTVSGTLRGVELVNVTNSTGITKAGTLRVNAGGTPVDTVVAIPPGTSDLVGFCKVIWPAPPDPVATVRLTVGAENQILTNVTIGQHRPWTLHFVMDKHLDYMWQYPTEAATRAAMEALTNDYLNAIEADKLANVFPHDEQTHFTFDQTIWWDAWTIQQPSQVNRLINAEATNHLGVGAFYVVLLTGILGTEELIRSMYPARQLQRDFGVDVQFSVPMETASVPWGLATVCSNAALPYMLKGICNCADQPSGGNDHPATLFRWKGPDGKSVILKWDNNFFNSKFFGGYAELYQIWSDGNDSVAMTTAQQNDILATISHHEMIGPGYPVDQIMLYGLGWDAWTIGPQRITNLIRAWNSALAAQGYEYPRIENSRPDEFFTSVETSLAVNGGTLLEFSGCFGTDWEVWILYHAKLYQQARLAREKLIAAETLAACASIFDTTNVSSQILQMREAYKGLLKIAEHSAGTALPFGSNFDAGPIAQLKMDCAAQADSTADAILAQSTSVIASKIRTGDQLEGQSLLILNPSQFSVNMIIETAVGAAGNYTVTDSTTGLVLPSQVLGVSPPFSLRFIAPSVPGLGYKTVRIKSGGNSPASPILVDSFAGTIENQFYKITVSPLSGAVISIKDKTRGNRELVNTTIGVPGANAFRAKGVYPASAAISSAAVGPVSGSLVITSAASGRSCVTTITLYDNIDRIDIKNDVTRPAVSDLTDEVTFDFPWKLGSVQHRYEAGASITRPGYTTQNPPGDHLPGSVQAYFAVQHWVDTNGLDELSQSGGVRVATPEACMFSLGNNTIWNSPQVNSPRVNFIGYDNAPPNANIGLGDQDDETQFTYRFSIQGYVGAFNGPENAKFTYPLTRSARTAALPANQAGALPADKYAFVKLNNTGAVLSTLKIAEEGLSAGYLLRMWDGGLTGAAAVANVGAFAAGTALHTDLLERDTTPPSPIAGSLNIPIPPRGFTTTRIFPGVANAPPTASIAAPSVVAPGANVLLNGSSSNDPDDAPTFHWVQISGKRVTLLTPDKRFTDFVAPSVSNAAEAALSFQLSVDDGKHLPSTTIVNVTVQLDATPPSAPSGLAATPSGQSIQLSWNPSSDPETGIAGYRIYRALGAGPFLLLTNIGNITNFLDAGLSPNQNYHYKVSAVNGAALEGSQSSQATATTGDDPPPAPTGLAAAAGAGSVFLTWQASAAADIVGYRVLRSLTSGSGFLQIADVGNNLNYLDSTVANGTVYYYKIAAYDAMQQGAPSAEISAAPQSVPLAPPVSLVSVAGSQLVSLTWHPSASPGILGYRIYRRESVVDPFVMIAQEALITIFTDYTAENGFNYQYVVRAFNATQESADSPIASGSPNGIFSSEHQVVVNGDDATSVNNVVRVSGYSGGDPVDYVSNDAEIESAGMIFPLPIPKNAIILSAIITVKAGTSQNADVNGAMRIHLYDVASVPPFSEGQPIDLLNYLPVLNTNILWSAGTHWSAGSEQTTSDLSALVQAAVNRNDWAPGNRIGFVVTEGTLGAGKYYGWLDSISGANDGVKLSVVWLDPQPPAPKLVLGALQIGQTGVATILGAVPNDVFALYYALAPATTPFYPYGNLLLDLNSIGEAAVGAVDGSGFASIPVDVPNIPSLAGVTVYMQAITARLNPNLDADLTNLVFTNLLP